MAKNALVEYNEFYSQAKARHTIAAGAIRTLEKDKNSLTERSNTLEDGREIVQAVLLLTQEQVKTAIEEVVSLALSSVYPGYAFELEYEYKRNQSEATPWIIKDGDKRSPRDEIGGGVLDIASLGMRLAMWSLMEPKPARVFILDEPAKFVSTDKQEAFGEMLKELSTKLDIQILLVSHNSTIINTADKTYQISQNKGISQAQAYNK